MQNQEKQSVLTKTFEGISHDEISAEYNLPDYLPDINRLLKVSAKIFESAHYLSGDAVEYDGKLKCQLLYATGDGSLKVRNLTVIFRERPLFREHRAIARSNLNRKSNRYPVVCKTHAS